MDFFVGLLFKKLYPRPFKADAITNRARILSMKKRLLPFYAIKGFYATHF